MKKNEFIEEVNALLNGISLDDSNNIINSICEKIPSNLYEVVLCIINDKTNKLTLSTEEIDKQMEELKADFKEIEEGNICFRCYSYETGYYDGWGDSDYGYEYYPTKEIANILYGAYELGKKFVYYKEYSRAIEVFDLILYSNYSCEEVGNPEYDNSDEVYDTFECRINDVKDDLNFSLDSVYLFAIYSVLAGNYPNKNNKIYNYLKENSYISIDKAISLGLDNLSNLDIFYKGWKEFLKTKDEDMARKLLEKLNI